MATPSTEPEAIWKTVELLQEARHLAILACSEATNVDAMLVYAHAANEIALRQLLFEASHTEWMGSIPG